MAGIADVRPRQGMKPLDCVFVDFEPAPLFVNELQGIPVAPDLFLVPVAQKGLAENHGGDPRAVDGNAFHAVGGHGALDHGMVSQGLQLLRRLPCEEFLLSSGLAEISQIQRRAGRYHGG